MTFVKCPSKDITEHKIGVELGLLGAELKGPQEKGWAFHLNPWLLEILSKDQLTTSLKFIKF